MHVALHLVSVFFIRSTLKITADALMPDRDGDVLDVLQLRDVVRMVLVGHARSAETTH